MTSNTAGLALICLVAGLGIPTMAALNSTLGVRIGTPGAALSLFAFATVIALVATLFTGGIDLSAAQDSPAHLWLGGAFVAFYVLAITAIAPRLGVATSVVFVLLGQLISSALIDHFGLFGAPRIPITPIRFAGLIVMATGVMLARRPTGV